MPARPNLQFDFEWRTSLAVALLLPLLLALGFWQLDRSEEKRGLQRVFEARAVAEPVALAEVWEAGADELAYLPSERLEALRARDDARRVIDLSKRWLEVHRA